MIWWSWWSGWSGWSVLQIEKISAWILIGAICKPRGFPHRLTWIAAGGEGAPMTQMSGCWVDETHTWQTFPLEIAAKKIQTSAYVSVMVYLHVFFLSAFSFTLPHLLGHSCRSTRWRWVARSREGTWPPLRALCAGLAGSVRRQPGGGRDDSVLLMVMSVVLLVVMFLLLLLVMVMTKIYSPLGLAMGRRPRTFVQTLLWKENDFCAFSFWSKSLVLIWIFD